MRERLEKGDSDKAVLDYVVDRYGEFVLLRPVFALHTLLLWLTPVLAILLGGFGIWRLARRRRPAVRPANSSAAEEAEVAALLRTGVESGAVVIRRRPSARVLDRGIADRMIGDAPRGRTMTAATLTISSRNYSSWSLRGWLICRMAGLDFETEVLSGTDAGSRAELLHLSPSFLVPRLRHGDVVVWDTLAIAEYLGETFPEAGLLPGPVAERAHCRSISGEMHSGFVNLRSALPMNLRAFHPAFRLFNGAKADIERIVTIFDDCLDRYEGPVPVRRRAPAWRTPCSPRSAPASAPTMSRCRPGPPPTATRSCTGR